MTPAGSVPSLLIPNTHSRAPSINEPSFQDATPYPAFLRLTKTDVQNKFGDLEWEQRKRYAAAIHNADSTPWARVDQALTMNRNRYANVDPYANNRVKLRVPEHHNDYINASPIVLENTKSGTKMKFIATQGPKGEITHHMWRMIWHETTSPAVVIMLTQTHESGKEKCYPYFPRSPSSPTITLNEHDEFEDGFTTTVTLQNLTKDEEARAQIRELEMRNADGSESKKIWHLLFGGWPDFLVPEGADRIALLKLIHMSRSKNADNSSNPRIIHCSAGVGRTGTFIALDWLLQELEEGSLDEVDEDADPIVDVVENLRHQRMMMVQGEAQFAFIYDVLRERWRDRWARLHPQEAEQLGITPVQQMQTQEPRHKKQRNSQDSDDSAGEGDSNVEGDEDMRAELEAELVQREVEFENGRT